MRFKPCKSLLLLPILFLSILAILPGVYNGHASISFVSTFSNGCAPCGATFTVGPQTISTSIGIVVSIFVEGAACTMTVTDSLSTSYGTAKICGSSSSTHPAVDIFAGISTSSGADTITITSCGGGGANCEAVVTTYSGPTGFGVVATNQQLNQPQGTFSNTVNLAGLGTQSWVVTSFTAESQTVSPTSPAGSTVRHLINPETNCPTAICAVADIPATTPLTWMYTTGAACAGGVCGASHSALELLATGGLPPPSSLVGCFGNCGSPAITLANTNSTHTVPFNTSITLLYEWQNNLNGYVNNVTVPIAKAYTNQFVDIAIYIVHGCPAGQSPFTNTCPAFGYGHLYGPSLSKGRLALSFNNFQIVVAAGDWLGVGVSAFYTGFDINDTNTAVAAFQTGGVTPSPVTNTQSFNAAFKMGLWAYVTGTTVSANPPPVPGPVTACAGLDCILTNIVNSFCTNLTTQCQLASSFFWIVILTGLSILIVVYFMAQTFPGINPKAVGLGELAIIIFIGWLVSFTSLGLMPAFFMVLIFLIVSWLFVGRLRGTGPI